jgi:hypothetical protein
VGYIKGGNCPHHILEGLLILCYDYEVLMEMLKMMKRVIPLAINVQFGEKETISSGMGAG